jgi:starch phosphorylase
VHLWLRIQDGELPKAPRMVMFAGKAAPGYVMAKLIIRFIHAVAELVNNDPKSKNVLRVAFLPNYSVSLAERIFPSCELSEQISTAGTEASGTGNMKAALNGSLTIGTLDGANVEIAEEVGLDNIFIFGLTVEQVTALRAAGYSPQAHIAQSPALAAVIDAIARGPLSKHGTFEGIHRTLTGEDRYLLCADFDLYVAAQQRAALTYTDRERWTRMSILNTGGMGKFSSDRTVREYAEEIWNLKAATIRLEEPPEEERRRNGVNAS